MNTKKIEKWVLLEQTGELSPRRLHKLNQCSAAQSKRDELNVLRTALPVLDAEPSPWTVTKINARLRTEHRPEAGFSKVWKSALALAACLLVVAGIFNFHERQTSSAPVVIMASAGVDVWNVPYEEDLGQLERLIVAISNDSVDIMEM